MRVDVEAGAPDEPEQRNAGGVREGDSEARGSGHRGDDRYATNPRLLHDLERDTAADDKDGRNHADFIDQHPAEHLVYRVVAADVLRRHDELASDGEERRAVKSAGFVECRLCRAETIR